MRKFLTHEVRWTEAVTNTLALGFSLMTMAVITYAAIFNPSVLTTVGSATSGITGVILGYYFNRERLIAAQRRAELEAQKRSGQPRAFPCLKKGWPPYPKISPTLC